MKEVLQFSDIDDYITTINLGVESKFPDFLVYDYEQTNPEACTQLPPFRQNYFEIALEVTDSCTTEVDQFELPATESRLLMISPHRLQTIKSDPGSDKACKGYGIFFKSEFISSDPANSRLLQDFHFFNKMNAPYISLEKGTVDHFSDIIRKIHSEYNDNTSYSREIIKNYLNILILKAQQNFPDSAVQQVNGLSRDHEIYHEFIHLVQSHFLQAKSVQAYAKKMHLSPKHLSETVKKFSGQSALDLIHSTQLNYAKALLRQTSKTVSEIAHDLNFENPEYFSVFFKRLTGENPSKFRIS